MISRLPALRHGGQLSKSRACSTTPVVVKESFRQRMLAFPKKHVFLTNMGLASSFMTVADLIAQIKEGDFWDQYRTGLFGGFGLVNGIMIWGMYGKILPWLFPESVAFAAKSFAAKRVDRVGQISVLKLAAFNNFLFSPFVFFPVFYLFKAVSVLAMAKEDLTPEAVFRGSARRTEAGFIEDNLMNLKLWLPGDAVCFAVPVWVRLPLSNAISFFFNVCLSMLRGKVQDDSEVARE